MTNRQRLVQDGAARARRRGDAKEWASAKPLTALIWRGGIPANGDLTRYEGGWHPQAFGLARWDRRALPSRMALLTVLELVASHLVAGLVKRVPKMGEVLCTSQNARVLATQ